MPATTVTVERFDTASTTEDEVKDLVTLRLQAWAIRSSYRREGTTWVIETEWNVFGQ